MEENIKSNNLSHRQWVDFLILYFATIKEYEGKIEPLRISLNQQNNFSPKSLFNYLDNNSKNFLSLDDFIKFLQDNSIIYDEKYLRQFIHNYDKDNDFCINYQEFLGIILPLTDDSYQKKEEENKKEEINTNVNNEKEDEKEKDEKNEKDNNIEKDNEKKENNENKDNKENINENNIENDKEKKENIEPSVLSLFGEILKEELSLAEKTIDISKQCLNSKFFTFYESFKEIADEEKFITEENLYNFLKKNGVELEEKDVKGLIHRNDTDNDGKISFPEYKEIFFPINNVKIKRNLNDINKYQNEYNSILRSGNSYKYNYNNITKTNYYPTRNNNFIDNNYNNDYNNYSNKNKSYYMPNNYKLEPYKSPKLKHTSSCLHYDYSTYADEDHNNNRSYKRYRNSSIANLKSYTNTLYNNNNCDLLYKRICCGCPLSSFIIQSNNNCCCYLCCEI